MVVERGHRLTVHAPGQRQLEQGGQNRRRADTDVQRVNLAVGIHGGLEAHQTGRAVQVVLCVFFARPDHLDRLAGHGLGDHHALACEVLRALAAQTTAELHDRLAALGAAAIVVVLADLQGHPPEAQPDLGICYAQKIDKSEARIDWSRPAREVDRQIRGLSPFPGAWCELAGKRIKLLACHMGQGSGAPGQVLGGGEVACGQGSVIITRVQLAGKTAQTTAEFLQGHALPEQLA